MGQAATGAVTKFLVDPNGFLPQVIAEMDNGGNILSYYIYDGVGLVAKMTSQSVHFYHYDGLGSTIAMTDASGNMVNKYAYDEFGNLMNSVEAISNPFLDLWLGTLMKIVTLEGWDVVIRSLYATNRKTKGDDFHQRPHRMIVARKELFPLGWVGILEFK